MRIASSPNCFSPATMTWRYFTKRSKSGPSQASIASAFAGEAGGVPAVALIVPTSARARLSCLGKRVSRQRGPYPYFARAYMGFSSSVVDRGRCGVLLVGDVLTPRDGAAFVVDLLHGDVGHEPVGGGAVPVILARLEVHAVARADDLGRAAAALAAPDAFVDVDGLAVGGG